MAATPAVPVLSARGQERSWSSAGLYVGYILGLLAMVASKAAGTVVHNIVVGSVLQLLGIAALVLAIRAARSRNLDRRTRRAWTLIAVSYALLVVARLLFSRYQEQQLFPSPADAVRLLYVPVLLAGLLWFPTRRLVDRDRYKVMLDTGIVLAGGFLLLWYLVIGPTMSASGVPLAAMLTAIGYLVGDLILLLGVATVLVRGSLPVSRRALAILTAGLGFAMISDVYLDHLRADVQWVNPQDWQFFCWMTGQFLLALAPSEQLRAARTRTGPASAQRRIKRLPYLALLVGHVVLLVVAFGQDLYPWGGLIIGAVVMSGLVVVRQLVAVRENRALGITDPLTGLANRRRLIEVLDAALFRVGSAGEPVAVLVIDLNGFKQINETYGNEVGDRMLVNFGGQLNRCVWGPSTVARIGADEFAIVLDGVGGVDNAIAVAKRIVAGMDDPVRVDTYELRHRASIGIAMSGPGADDSADLLHRADVAMHRAKSRRTSSWELYVDGMENILHGGDLEQDLYAAVSGGQLRLQYQPIVSLHTGELVGVEALVRWQHPVHGMLQPDMFIPVAERIGAIVELGTWVLETACRQVRHWRQWLPPGRQLRLNVNLSPGQLGEASLVEDVIAILVRTGFDPAHLVLEVTENALVDGGSAIAKLRELNEHGIRIALDDFGTGYSSLRYLTRLPVDILKIDRCFVAEMNGSQEGAAVAEAVIRLSQMLHLDTVAEGVEQASQAHELVALGCVAGQGYHFARPLDPEALEKLITTLGTAWPMLPVSADLGARGSLTPAPPQRALPAATAGTRGATVASRTGRRSA